MAKITIAIAAATLLGKVVDWRRERERRRHERRLWRIEMAALKEAGKAICYDCGRRD